jgi:hypothetical protein
MVDIVQHETAEGTWTLSRRENGWSAWVRFRVEPPDSDSDLIVFTADLAAWTRDVDGQPVPPPDDEDVINAAIAAGPKGIATRRRSETGHG